MIAECENEFICDMAETYHIYDYRGVPGRLLSTLAAGLRDDSRTIIKLSGAKVPTQTLLLATIADELSGIAWAIGGDRNAKMPELITEKILEIKEEKPELSFASGEDFEKMRKAILEELRNGRNL